MPPPRDLTHKQMRVMSIWRHYRSASHFSFRSRCPRFRRGFFVIECWCSHLLINLCFSYNLRRRSRGLTYWAINSGSTFSNPTVIKTLLPAPIQTIGETVVYMRQYGDIYIYIYIYIYIKEETRKRTQTQTHISKEWALHKCARVYIYIYIYSPLCHEQDA